MFGQANVQTATQGHRESGVGLVSRGQRIVKARAQVRHAEQRVCKRRDVSRAQVESRTNHQVISLHTGIEGAATSQIRVADVIECAGEAGHDADVAVHVLVELSRETVVARALIRKIDAITVKGCSATTIKMIRVVIGAHVRVADIKFIERIVFIAALCECSRNTEQSNQEQEKDSGHSGRLLVDPVDFGLKLYRYTNTTNAEKIPRFFGKLFLFLSGEVRILVRQRTQFYLTLGNALIIVAIALVFSAASPAQTPADTTREAQRLTRVAQVAQQQGRYDDAIKAYQTITVVAAGSPQIAASAHVAAGNIFMMQGRFEEAAAAFRKAVALDASSAEAINNLGEALGELKQFQPALQAFQKAVALDPKYLKPRYNMGVTYDRLGQMKYAEFIYRILIRDFPDFALAYDSLAVSLSKSGRAREAAPFHERAIALAPADPSFYFNYSLTCLMLGDFKKAQEQQQKLRALDPAMAEHLAMMIAKRQRS